MKQIKKYTKHVRFTTASGFAMATIGFVVGGYLAQSGAYVYLKASVGAFDDSLITYSGFVTPIESIPDYQRWKTYGGSSEENTYEQVPKDILVPLPKYDLARQTIPAASSTENAVYTVGHQASYDKGWDTTGSHAGVDIRAPKNTPVRAVANGIVEQVKEAPGGFGKYIVIRHPHVPDPESPGKTTVLYSSYAHLNTQLVSVGDSVEKGQMIGTIGKTGLATGYQLHVQLDKESAPFYPYWPFTSSEASQAGTNYWSGVNQGLFKERINQYSVHPMLFIEANMTDIPATQKETVAVKPDTKTTPEDRIKQRRDRRKSAIGTTSPASPIALVRTVTMASNVQKQSEITVAGADIKVAGNHSGNIEWQTVQITLLGEDGQYVDGNALDTSLYLRTAYGEAEFDPPTLGAKDFQNGTAIVRMRPQSDRTIVILIQPFGSMSAPIRMQKKL